MSVHKKIQPNRCSRLAGYTQHIYIRMSCFIISIDIYFNINFLHIALWRILKIENVLMKRSYFKTHGAQWGLKLKTHHWGQKSGTQIENVQIQRRVQDETSETTVRNLINLLSFTRGSLFCQIFWNTIISYFFKFVILSNSQFGWYCVS